MHTVMTAVVSRDDDRIFITEFFNDTACVINGNGNAVQICICHPSVVMTALFIGIDLIEEYEIGFFRINELDRGIGEDGIHAFIGISIDIRCKFAGIGRCDIAKRFPTVENGIDTAVSGDLFKKTLDVMYLRYERIGNDAVAHRFDAVENRHMTGKCDGGGHASCIKGIGGFCHQGGKIVVSARFESVGTHTVDRDNDHFFFHVFLYSFRLKNFFKYCFC